MLPRHFAPYADTGILVGFAYVIALYAAVAAAAWLLIVRERREPRPGWATIALVAVVAIPSVVGLAVPAIREALQRDADRIGDGEVWPTRLTSRHN